MLLSQEEIDSVLRSAEAAVNEIAASVDGPRGGGARSGGTAHVGDRMRRLSHLAVPVIVRLASRSLPLADILQWGRGTIVEFGKSVSESLELLASNRVIGRGEAVKVGENFGLRIATIGNAAGATPPRGTRV